MGSYRRKATNFRLCGKHQGLLYDSGRHLIVDTGIIVLTFYNKVSAIRYV